MEISKGCNVAGDWPSGHTGGITEPIWLQILLLNPEKEGGKREILSFQQGFWLLRGEATDN